MRNVGIDRKKRSEAILDGWSGEAIERQPEMEYIKRTCRRCLSEQLAVLRE